VPEASVICARNYSLVRYADAVYPPTIEYGSLISRSTCAQESSEETAAQYGCRKNLFSVLTVLLGSAGEVVTREELRERLWAEDTFVDFDHRLAVAVSRLKDALRDSAGKPRLIETVGRRGYRFVGQLERADVSSADSSRGTSDPSLASSHPAEQTQLPKPAHQHPRRSRILLFSFGFVILLAGIALTKLVHVRSGEGQSTTPRSLAILPLQNRGEDSTSDFLGLSLASRNWPQFEGSGLGGWNIQSMSVTKRRK
jgi:DNA-binding winged helix-turn-helix (wHTH) protein